MTDPSPFGRSEQLWRQWKLTDRILPPVRRNPGRPANQREAPAPRPLKMLPCSRRRVIHASPAVRATPVLAKRTEITKQTELNVINCSDCKYGDGASRNELSRKAKQNRSPAGAPGVFPRGASVQRDDWRDHFFLFGQRLKNRHEQPQVTQARSHVH